VRTPVPLPAPPTTRAAVLALRGGGASRRGDVVVTEEPLEIRVRGLHQEPVPIAVTMRTPGSDFALAVGLLHTEGLLPDVSAVAAVSYCDTTPPERGPGAGWDSPPESLPAPGRRPGAGERSVLGSPLDEAADGLDLLAGSAGVATNVVTVSLSVPFTPPAPRAFVTAASCGICGAASLEALERRVGPVGAGEVVPLGVLQGLPEALRARQTLFAATGGLHAAGLFAPSGELVSVAEDVGRHNALDKLVGEAALAKRLPLSSSVLVVSGRVSFEIVQKAAVAGIPVIGAVSAPSSLAVAAAEALRITLVGFLRGSSCNVYTHPERLSGLPTDGGRGIRSAPPADPAPRANPTIGTTPTIANPTIGTTPTIANEEAPPWPSATPA